METKATGLYEVLDLASCELADGNGVEMRRTGRLVIGPVALAVVIAAAGGAGCRGSVGSAPTVPSKESVTVSQSLSKHLGPSAKKIAMRSVGDERVSTLIQVAPSIDRQAFQGQVAANGGTVQSWMPEASLVTVEISAKHLSELADMKGVVYVEASQKYQQ
ncbi:MAG TPA: hypothetical protein VJY33_18950 [Isosphaeraceae bacterium]|nr:hypothetical protein [Isosphaeraceae bacterium]